MTHTDNEREENANISEKGWCFFNGKKGENAMRGSRHNGRYGKNGVYNPKHNDHRFDVENSEHIDEVKAEANIYWDCYQGMRIGCEDETGIKSFEEIEAMFYEEHYSGFINAQNQRNIENRHPERNRTLEDLRLSKKTCPEETIIQIGKYQETIPYELLIEIAEEYFRRLTEKYGECFHIIDWALHIDESTPHIHERHVFDCPNKYGEIAPQQDKALEVLGIDLPDPAKKSGRYNNRKMTFDEECRELFLSVCEEYMVELEREPQYRGKKNQEKQEYINEQISEKNDELKRENAELKTTVESQLEKYDELSARIEDIETFQDEVAEEAYKKATEAVNKKAGELLQTMTNTQIDQIEKDLQSDPKYEKNRRFAMSVLKALRENIKNAYAALLGATAKVFADEKVKAPIKEEVKKATGISIRDKLDQGKKRVTEQQSGGIKKNKHKEQE